MFEKILVCLDGSDAAEHTLSYITEETMKLNSKVILLRVIDLPESTLSVNIPGSPAVSVPTQRAIKRTIDEEKEANSYLKRKATALQKKKIDVDYLVLSGRTGETIISYAQENNCTLIIIATRGRGGFKRFALGSTADFVVRHSTVPVLTVRR